MEVRPLLTITAGNYTLYLSTEDISFGFPEPAGGVVTWQAGAVTWQDGEVAWQGNVAPWSPSSMILYEGRIIDIGGVQQAATESFYGVTSSNAVSVSLDNTDGYFSKLCTATELRGATVKYQLVDIETYEVLRTFYFKIESFNLTPTEAEISMRDGDADLWETTLPKYRITEDLFDTGSIPDESLGKPVGVWFGEAKRVPLYCIAENTDTDEYDYLIGHGDIDSVVQVYREGGGTKATVNNTIVASGVNTTSTDLRLIDSDATFISSGVQRNMAVINTNSGAGAFVESVDSETQLTLTKDIFDASATGEAYQIGGEYLFYDGSQSSPYPGFAFLRFTLQQRDANLNAYNMSADVVGIQSGGNSMNNPIWILYLLITDTEWGLGLGASSADMSSFITAGELCAGIAWRAAGGLWEFKKAKEWRDMLLLQAKMSQLRIGSSGKYEVSIPTYTEGTDTYNKYNMQVKSYSAKSVDEYSKESIVHYKYDLSEGNYLLEQKHDNGSAFGQSRDYYAPLMENDDGAAALAKLISNRFFYQDRVLEFTTGPEAIPVEVNDAIIIDYHDMEIYQTNYEVLEVDIGHDSVTIKAGAFPMDLLAY